MFLNGHPHFFWREKSLSCLTVMIGFLIIINPVTMKKIYAMTIAAFSLFNAYAQTPGDYRLLVGTYTSPGKSEGIYIFDFQSRTADTRLVSLTKNVINPSYLAITPEHDFVYAVNENGKESTISAFSFDASTGKLAYLNKQDAKGADPCYLIADSQHVISANYSGGTIAVFRRQADGGLSPAKQVIQHSGSGPDTARQESAHVHMVRFTPDKKFVVVSDLGLDKVFIYQYHPDAQKEVLTLKDSVMVKAGSGPRHIVFSPSGKNAYLIQELSGSVTAFNYEEGKLMPIQEISMLAPGFKGETGAADIQISADGKFLYTSNRGTANTITTFAIGTGGQLSYKAINSSLGNGPRAFTIDPSGKWLFVGHQYTDEIVIFSRNPINGYLKDSGKRIAVGAPVSLTFVAR